MADSLARLRRELIDLDDARKKLNDLEQKAAQSADAAAQEQKLARQRTRVAGNERKVQETREVLAREAARSREDAGAAKNSLAELDARRAAGAVGEASYVTETRRLQRRVTEDERQAELLQRATTADSAAELRTITAPEPRPKLGEESSEELIQRYTEPRGLEWPGITVPERIVMLWRESKKSGSRKPVIVSGVIVAALILVLIGVVAVSGHMSPKEASDYLGKGEVLVPVLVDDARNVRSLQFTVAYDPEMLTGMSVIQGDVAQLGVMQYDILKSGKIEVSVRDITGIEGSGSIVIMRFRSHEILPEPSPLLLESLSAVDLDTMEERPMRGEAGWVDTATLEVMAPVLSFP